MASERGLLVVACFAVGAGALALAALPGDRPPPTTNGFDAALLSGVRDAAAAVDAACARGDAAAFAAATTDAHRATLARRLRALDGELDADGLRALAAAGQAAWLQGEVLAGAAAGAHTAVVVARGPRDGAQVVTFAWDGRRWRLHDSRHDAALHGEPAARAAVAEALARRAR